MSHEKYIRYDFTHSLGHFIEECGEALAAAGKTERWGPYCVNPEIPVHEQENNVSWLRRELEDLRGAIDRLTACIDEGRVEDIQAEVETLRECESLLKPECPVV